MSIAVIVVTILTVAGVAVIIAATIYYISVISKNFVITACCNCNITASSHDVVYNLKPCSYIFIIFKSTRLDALTIFAWRQNP